MNVVPSLRIRDVNYVRVNTDGRFVLYWMPAFRRAGWNFALQRAVEWAKELGKPILVLEHLLSGQRWDSDRLHRFVLDGMADNADRFRNTPARYYPFVEPEPGAGKDLVRTLAESAAVVVTDDYPCRPVPELVGEVARSVACLVEAVDSNGLLPLRAAERTYPTAHAFRRLLQKELPAHLEAFPVANPLARVKLPSLKRMPSGVVKRWPEASPGLLRGSAGAMARLPIDHAVGPVEPRGGPAVGKLALGEFVDRRLASYAADRNHPDLDATSGLSPYLHFGHVSAHEVFRRVVEAEDWSPDRLSPRASGSRGGWWGMSESAEGFLDELITWREVGYNFASRREDYDAYASLPDWARRTLEEHAGDRRQYRYTPAEFREARTHDRLWNAAQRQLLREGRLHNYMRMLWGKKILEWTGSPQEALEVMTELNNAYALDGRDPNSWSGIFWVLGRYDRAWGPERPIFGKIRYMSSENTARKLRVSRYLDRYAPDALQA